MTFRTLGITILLSLLSSLTYARSGRSPAVEDFVGIEVEHPAGTPQGTEALFNFEKDINDFQSVKDEKSKAALVKSSTHSEEDPFNVMSFVSIFALVALPITTWFLFMSHLKRKVTTSNASNIAVLENYKKEKALREKSDIKKAS